MLEWLAIIAGFALLYRLRMQVETLEARATEFSRIVSELRSPLAGGECPALARRDARDA